MRVMLKVILRRGFRDLVFFAGFAVLACHELDAVAQSEWKLLPVLNTLPDETAYSVFVIAHIPIFAALMWLAGHSSVIVRRRAQLGIDAFLVVHAGMHALMSGHSLYLFHSPLSSFLIYGGALVGLAHIGMLVAELKAAGR